MPQHGVDVPLMKETLGFQIGLILFNKIGEAAEGA
jgi:hypothetical protein